MIEGPRFPPLYRPLPIDDGNALERACAAAAAGAEAGTLVWSRRADRFDCAVVLEPDRPLGAALVVVPVAALALVDALGAVGPPNHPIALGWPDRVLVDGALVGGIRLGRIDGDFADFKGDFADFKGDFAYGDVAAVPDRLVVAAVVDVLGDPDDDAPGRHPERTDLREEGFDEVAVPDLAESFSRHLLLWMTRWIEDGFDPLRVALLHRLAPEAGVPVRDIAEDGALLLGGDRIPLAQALAASAWRLPDRPARFAEETPWP